MEPVSARTRSREALMFRKLHEEIKRKKSESGSSSSGGLKISSDSSSNLNFNGCKKLEVKNKRKTANGYGSMSFQNRNLDKDCVFDVHSVKDSNFGSNAFDFDVGSSNFESSFVKKKVRSKSSPGIEVEESCSGPKFGVSGVLDSVDNDDDEVIEISDGSVELSSSDREIEDFDRFSSGESEDDKDDEDFKEEEHYRTEEPAGSDSVEEIGSENEEDEVEVCKISEKGKRGKFESSRKKRSQVLGGDDDGDDVEVVGRKKFRVLSEDEGGDDFRWVGKEKFRVLSDDEDGDDVEFVGVKRFQAPADEVTGVGVMSKNKPRNRYYKMSIVEKLGKSMFDDDVGDEEDDIAQPESPNLPQKFVFGVEKPPVIEKTDAEIEEEELWAEFDMGYSTFAKKKSKKKNKSKNRNHRTDTVQILGNSLFNHEDEVEEVVIAQPESPKLEQRFLFGVKEMPVVEKTQAEIEEEELWAEMHLGLCGEDTACRTRVESEADTSANPESSVAENCSQGKHVLILEEEIGVICKYCRFVQQEIRYYTAPFDKNPFGRSNRRGSYREEINNLENLHLHDIENDGSGPDDTSYNAHGKVWDIVPGLRKDLHPHQRDGFEFLWRNIGGSINLNELKESAPSDKASGCIISHAPGTGKTRLAIVFIQSYMRMYPSCKPVILAPCGMLLYWESEFKKWNVDIPFHNLNNQYLSRKENQTALKWVRNRNLDKATVRMVKLYSWKKDRGVLALSYKLFEELVGEEMKGGKTRVKAKDANVQKALLEVPNLLILDEGHTPRNNQSLIWKALSRVQTTKRIILSGTPFQNNFDELYNTICLARPQFADLFGNDSEEGLAYRRLKKSAKKKWNSLTAPIGKENTNCRQKAKRLEKVRDLISPFVHVHEGNILQHKLPGLRSAAIILQPNELQGQLLDKVQEEESLRHFEMEYLVSAVSVHPSLMPEKLTADFGQFQRLQLDPDAGVKTKFLMELVRISCHLNEKVLVFSQFIEPLKLVSRQLTEWFGWREEAEILSMDGATEPATRQTIIKNFNDPRNGAKVMLASTRACSEGINLVGASRVVMLDVVWNPAVERQAISRAYRLGQTKVVYIYHLLTSGTMEEDKYCRQARKEQLSDLVFYSSERAQNHDKLSSKLSEDKTDKILETMVEGDKLKDILKQIIYEPKASFNASFGLLGV